MTTVEENKLNFFLKYNTSEARGDRLGCLGVTVSVKRRMSTTHARKDNYIICSVVLLYVALALY